MEALLAQKGVHAVGGGLLLVLRVQHLLQRPTAKPRQHIRQQDHHHLLAGIHPLRKPIFMQNASNKNIEGICHSEHNNASLLAAYQVVMNHQQKFIVFYDSFVELVGIFSNAINETQRLITLKKGLRLTGESIVFNNENATFALYVKAPSSTFIFVSAPGFLSTSQLEIPNCEGSHITDVFWLKERLIALDSSLYFYDLTHER